MERRIRRRIGRGREEEREEISGMDTCFGMYGATLDIRISCLAFDLSRVLLGFHLNPRFLESRVGKTLNGTRRIWIPPFEVGFMV